jgi:hypothetical protein
LQDGAANKELGWSRNPRYPPRIIFRRWTATCLCDSIRAVGCGRLGSGHVGREVRVSRPRRPDASRTDAPRIAWRSRRSDARGQGAADVAMNGGQTVRWMGRSRLRSGSDRAPSPATGDGLRPGRWGPMPRHGLTGRGPTGRRWLDFGPTGAFPAFGISRAPGRRCSDPFQMRQGRPRACAAGSQLQRLAGCQANAARMSSSVSSG